VLALGRGEKGGTGSRGVVAWRVRAPQGSDAGWRKGWGARRAVRAGGGAVRSRPAASSRAIVFF
jgi:hypothetical protein